jgi:hypothetical protein
MDSDGPPVRYQNLIPVKVCMDSDFFYIREQSTLLYFFIGCRALEAPDPSASVRAGAPPVLPMVMCFGLVFSQHCSKYVLNIKEE